MRLFVKNKFLYGDGCLYGICRLKTGIWEALLLKRPRKNERKKIEFFMCLSPYAGKRRRVWLKRAERFN